MATQTKATPAKATPAAPAVAETPKSADLDFSALTLEDAPVADLKRSRTTILDRSPVLNWLRQSYEEGKAKSVTVPKDQAKGLERLLRSGVDRLTSETGTRVGVAVTLHEAGDNTRVSFLAKDRRKYSPRKAGENKA